MIHHASYELREAIEGVPPAGLDREGADPFSEYELPTCGDSIGQTSKAALAYLWRGATDVDDAEWFEDPTPIDCRACLALVRSAIGPARLAQLEVEADRLHGVIAAWQQAEAEAPTCRNCGGAFIPGKRAIECERCAADAWLLRDDDFAALGRAVDLRYPAQCAQKWLAAFRALVPATVGGATAADQSAASAG